MSLLCQSLLFLSSGGETSQYLINLDEYYLLHTYPSALEVVFCLFYNVF